MTLGPTGRDLFFYDGTCGLCHGAVRFLLARDPGGQAFAFAPLQGRTFIDSVPANQRDRLPDSVVVLTATDAVLVRSDAVIHTLERLGSGWRLVATVVRLVPRRLRDGAYDLVARVRRRFAGRPDALCPVVPAELRTRFRD